MLDEAIMFTSLTRRDRDLPVCRPPRVSVIVSIACLRVDRDAVVLDPGQEDGVQILSTPLSTVSVGVLVVPDLSQRVA